MKHFQKSTFFLLLVALCLSQFKGSEASHRRHHHRHNRFSHHRHRHPVTSDEGSLVEVDELPGGNEDLDFVAAYRGTADEAEDDNSGSSSSVESRSSSLEGHGRYSTLCLEDEEDIDRKISYLGVQCMCPKIKAPVCGSDGVTYHNRCFLVCRAKKAFEAYHRHRITLRKFGPC